MRAIKKSILSGFLSVVLCMVVWADSSLPLGDGKIASQPTVGYVYQCGTVRGRARGPSVTGPWISGHQWYPDRKPTVQGSVRWTDARLSIEVAGGERIIRTSALPMHATGTFPIRSDDPAYRYDRNPNRIAEHDVSLRIPANPREAAVPQCLTPGPIGYMLTGVALFDALDAGGKDAPAHEVQDSCSGHPQERGQYHYHSASNCLSDNAGKRGEHSDLVGYAADGFGIYGLRGENGVEMTNSDLDVCHGHIHVVKWDGKSTRMYHYHLTRMYPYTLGCFRGTPVQLEMGGQRRGRDPRGRRSEQRQRHDFPPPPPFPPRPRGQR